MARRSAAKTYGTIRNGITFDSNIVEKLSEWEDKFLDEGLRRIAYSGAKALYDELLIRAPVGPPKNDRASKPLREAIYHWHDDKVSTRKLQSYVIGVNKAKAPHWWLVEHGHYRYHAIGLVNGRWKTFKDRPLSTPVWVPPHPYLRPAFESKMRTALQASLDRFYEIADRIFKGQPVA